MLFVAMVLRESVCCPGNYEKDLLSILFPRISDIMLVALRSLDVWDMKFLISLCKTFVVTQQAFIVTLLAHCPFLP